MSFSLIIVTLTTLAVGYSNLLDEACSWSLAETGAEVVVRT